MLGEFLTLQYFVVLVELYHSAKIKLQFFSFGGQACSQLGQRSRGQDISLLQKGSNLCLLASLGPVCDCIEQIESNGFPLLADGEGGFCDQFFSFFPDFFLALDDDGPHVFQKVAGGDCDGFMVIVVAEEFDFFLSGFAVVPYFDLFGQRPAWVDYAFVIDWLLLVIDGSFYIYFFCDFEEVVWGHVVVLEVFE